jgi:hypothetical protein
MKKTSPLAVLALVAAAALATAQEKAEAPGPRKPVVPLKVRLVLWKLQGDKAVGNLPYTLTCNADDRTGNHLRMGIEVPVLVSPIKEGPSSYQYRSVGTNIDCRASALDDGRFRLDLTVEHSSIYSPPEDAQRPLFRTFKSGFVPILRDGQTMQYTVATDPVTGEVVKVEVGLSVLK